MSVELEARLEALEHVVSVLVSQASIPVAMARKVSLPTATVDLGETIIRWSPGFPSKTPDQFGDALVSLMKKAWAVSQANHNVRGDLGG